MEIGRAKRARARMRPSQTKRWWMTCELHEGLARPLCLAWKSLGGRRPLIRLARPSHASVGPMGALFVRVSACKLACDSRSLTADGCAVWRGKTGHMPTCKVSLSRTRAGRGRTETSRPARLELIELLNVRAKNAIVEKTHRQVSQSDAVPTSRIAKHSLFVLPSPQNPLPLRRTQPVRAASLPP